VTSLLGTVKSLPFFTVHELYFSKVSDPLQFFSRRFYNLVAIAWDSPFNERVGRLPFQARMVETAMDDIGREAASTLLARQQRNGRLYDVPQIGELVSQGTLQINEPLPFNVPNNNVLHINRSLLQPGKVDVCSIIVPLNALRSTYTERKKTKRKNVPNQNA